MIDDKSEKSGIIARDFSTLIKANPGVVNSPNQDSPQYVAKVDTTIENYCKTNDLNDRRNFMKIGSSAVTEDLGQRIKENIPLIDKLIFAESVDIEFS